MEACIFSGQGTQFQGMGKELFDKYSSHLDICDEILGYSIKKLCLEDYENKLNQTQYTQPAVYVVNALSYFEYLNKNKKPSIVAGHSLGEYNALMAADVFDFATGLRIVKKRGELMGEIKGGGMAAILGTNAKTVSKVLEQYELSDLYISNYNSPLQTVIGGKSKDIKLAKSIFEATGCGHYLILNVSAAFHTVYMEDAKKKFSLEIKKTHFNSPKISVVSNVTAKPYNHSKIEETIINQMTCPVRWNETIIYMLKHGVEKISSIDPSRVLHNLYNQIRKEFEKSNKKIRQL